MTKKNMQPKKMWEALASNIMGRFSQDVNKKVTKSKANGKHTAPTTTTK